VGVGGVGQACRERFLGRPVLLGLDQAWVAGEQPADRRAVAVADGGEQQDGIAEPPRPRRAGGGKVIGGHGQQLLQAPAGDECPLLGGGQPDPEEEGNLRVGQAGQVVQGDDDPLALRQRLDGRPHSLAVGPPDRDTCGVGCVVRHLVIQRLRHDRVATALAVTGGPDEAKEPGRKRSCILQLAQMPKGEGERLLRHVPGGLDVARPPERRRHGNILEAADQLRPGVRAAGPRRLHHRVQTFDPAGHRYEEGAARRPVGYRRRPVGHRCRGQSR
jgi:uncharacterized protein (DUF2249 family)